MGVGAWTDTIMIGQYFMLVAKQGPIYDVMYLLMACVDVTKC